MLLGVNSDGKREWLRYKEGGNWKVEEREERKNERERERERVWGDKRQRKRGL